MAARLQHPNIAAIHEAGADLSLRRAIEAIRDAARAVAHAHAQGVIHRDLKPRNILIGDRLKVGASAVACRVAPPTCTLKRAPVRLDP